MLLKKILLISILLVVSVVRAKCIEIDGINYNLNQNNGENTAQVTYRLNQYSASGVAYYYGNITIPSQITYQNVIYSVTSIGENAFNRCSGLTSITIPESVTNIEFNAFSGCSGLTSITIPESVTSIGGSAFSGCSGLTIITIPESVMSIGAYAFRNCSNLTSINIPNGITSIDGTFDGCSGLTSIIIPESVTIIGGNAFSGCSGLVSITIPEGVTSIRAHAFDGCSGLTSIKIPNSVKNIELAAFRNCSGLTYIEILDGVSSIGNLAFDGCNGLDTVYINSNAIVSSISYSTSGNSLKSIFGTQVKKYVLGKSVKYIGGYAFSGCSELTSITIPESVTSIGAHAFSGCSGLTSITIPESVTSIEGNTFSGCSGLTSITIPKSVTSIGSLAFSGCSGLTSINIPNSVTSVGSGAFDGTPWIFNQPDGLIYTGWVIYSYKGSMLNNTDIVLKEGTTEIASYAFKDCSALTSMTIPESVTSIGIEAFQDCKLEKIIANNPLTKFGNNSFSDRTLQHAMLYIPLGTWGQAVYDGDWYQFNNIREVTITSQSLSQARAYTMMNAQNYGYAIYNEVDDAVSFVKAFYNIDEENPYNSWQIIDQADGKSVMNIGSKKYLNILKDGEFYLSDTPVILNVSDSKNGITINGIEQEWMFVTNNKVSINNITKVDVQKDYSIESGKYYSIDGVLMLEPIKGINIIRTQNGTVKKVFK